MSMPMTFPQLLRFYREHLLEDIMPFWLKHTIDREYGGILNRVSDDGTVLSTDKYMWSQGRALWTFSALYNEMGHDRKWLEIADGIAEFIIRHGRNEQGDWYFSVRRDGQPAEPPKSVYVDAFAICGLTEYARATGNRQALELAVDSFHRTKGKLYEHASLPTEPHRIPQGMQSHGPFMIFAHTYYELGRLTNQAEILRESLKLAEIVMEQHVKPGPEVLLEFVLPGGGEADSDAGRTFLPGHAIESMWFLERIFAWFNKPEYVSLAFRAVRWHLEKGWDPQHGGIFLACHTQGGTPVWHSPDSKVWWPACESLYALLRAYEATGEQWCLDWYWKVHEYAFSAYPNREHGEWFQNLDRTGKPIPVVVKNLAVKDPFHLPRALIHAIAVLRRLSGADGTVAGR